MKQVPSRRIVAILAAAALFTGTASAAFPDAASLANQKDVAYVTEQGLFTGVTADRFAPEQPMTRAMAVTVLGRLAKTQGRVSADLTDVPETAYYAPYAGWAAENNLIDADSLFAPDGVMTRGTMCALLDQYWSYLGRTDAAPAWLSSDDQALTRGEAATAFATLSRTLAARETTVLTHKAADGVTLTGKLDLPETGAIDRIVLFINGSGPNTYDNKRATDDLSFTYFDLFAEQLAARGMGFFRWNTRGVSLSEQPPTYDSVDAQTYKTYLPQTSISDIGAWISVLKQNPRLRDASVYLLGWSEGTIIAPLAAKTFPAQIDGLLLAGYCNDRMDEILDWQQTGGSSMLVYGHYFDANGDGTISRAEFDADPYGVLPYLGAQWADFDANGDERLTREDFRSLLAPGYQALLDAFAGDKDAWLAENYGVRLTGAWLRAHNQLPPNSQTLPTLSLPIAILQGTLDANCGIAGTYAIRDTFKTLGKTNLTVQIYDGYDHDLNYALYPLTGAMPQAFEDLFRLCGSLS